MATHWSDRYLGLPYDEKTFDCGAFAERVRREVFGQQITLPSERREGPFGRNAQIAERLSDYARRVESPCDGDGVLLVVRGRMQHIGIYCLIGGEPWVVHNQESVGVHRIRVRDLPKWRYQVEGFYKWI